MDINDLTCWPLYVEGIIFSVYVEEEFTYRFREILTFTKTSDLMKKILWSCWNKKTLVNPQTSRRRKICLELTNQTAAITPAVFNSHLQLCCLSKNSASARPRLGLCFHHLTIVMMLYARQESVDPRRKENFISGSFDGADGLIRQPVPTTVQYEASVPPC